MSNFNDNIFRALQQFIKEFGDEFETLEEAIEEFMTYYEEADEYDFELEPTIEIESIDLFEQAMETRNLTKREKLLIQATEIWPSNWDAQVELIQGSMHEQINQVRELEAQAREEWEDTDQGGWYNIEERPYFRLKYHLIALLFKQGLLLDAQKHMREYLEMDPFDSLGVRYHLMAVYCRLYDWKNALELYNSVPYEVEKDDRMIVPLLVLAILLEKKTYMHDLFHELKSANKELERLFVDDQWPMEEIVAQSEVENYRIGTFTSLALSFMDILPVVVGSDYCFDWMKNAYYSDSPYTKINVSDKVISFEGVKQQRENESSVDNQVEMFQNIVYRAKEALAAAELLSYESFLKVTEKEVLALKHIGPKTIQQLKKNGVIFKE